MKFPAFEPINLKNNSDSLSIADLLLSQVIPDEKQPRKNFDKRALEELAASIKEHGIIQPIIVKNIVADKYQIIAGERRWRASQLAGLSVIPAIIQDNNAEKNVAISLIENIQREELNPIELAESFYNLNINYGFSHEVIAHMVGKSRAAVTNLLRLLNLSLPIRELLINGQIEMGHARALLTLSDEQQLIFSHRIVEKHLSVRDTEKLVQKYKTPEREQINPYLEEISVLTKKLSTLFSSKISITINEKGEGKVTIPFTSPVELDWLIKQAEELS